MFSIEIANLKILEKLKNWDFNGKMSKNSQFIPKMAQKAPRDP